ncbi:MAG: hypothetical protein H0W89_03740 [Candidatus Levybacteria bacterium]|nr:hypothetical protein [Candidatus Levybacteria bacterium]
MTIFIVLFLILFPVGLSGFRAIETPTAELQMTPTTSPRTVVHGQTTQTPIETDPQKKLLDYIQNRKPLSKTDSEAKTSILSMLPNGSPSGIVHKDTAFMVEYIKSADMFQVEILAGAVDGTKSEAIAWFKKQGMSEVGICSLPVSFYLNYQIANEFKKQNIPFNPLPPSC